MTKKHLLTFGVAAFTASALMVPANAAAKKAAAKPAAKPAAKGKDMKKGGKPADQPGTPHKWTAAFSTGYGWQNSDTNADIVWGADIQTKIKKRQTIGLSVSYTQNELEPRRRPSRELETLGVHLSWLIHTGEDMKNRQPGMYIGFGPSLIMGDLDTVGKETEFGWHAKLGVDFKTGLYSEVLFSDTQPSSKFNNAKLGGTHFSAGYRWSL